MADYLRDGASPDDWDVQDPSGLVGDDGEPLRVRSFGEVVGRDGCAADGQDVAFAERCEFYGVA